MQRFQHILFLALILASCNQPGRLVTEAKPIMLLIELDSNGQISSAKTRAEILAIGKAVHQSGDKMMMTVYTEQQGSEEKNNETGWMLARAVKILMKTQGERSSYNIGIIVKGYENPVDSANPANLINRRIEIANLK